MTRIIVTTIAGMLVCSAAIAQDSSDTSSLADAPPSVNVSGASLSERAPGNIIQDALDRHRGFINERVNGVESDLTGTAGTTSPTGTGTTGTSSLTGLLDALGGGGSLTEAATGLLGGSGSGATGGLSADAIRETIDAAIAANGGITSQQNSNFELTGGAFDRLPKPELREQSVVEEEEDSFRIRLLNAWAGTLFTSLTFGFQTQDFIDLLEAGLRPLFTPPTISTGDGTTGGDTTAGGPGIEGVGTDAGDTGDGSVI